MSAHRPHWTLRLGLVTLAATLASTALPAGATTITVVPIDGPNEGYNDPTPVAPVGGNTGTTLGQQRLIAVQHAANIWASLLDSDAPIFVRSAFNPLFCTATSATLASASSIQVFRNSDGVDLANVWYHVALANKLAGVDLSPGTDDINTQFNSSVDDPVCLGSRDFYYGLDNNHGGDSNLINTALHEIGHGLGFANFVNEVNGTLLSGGSDIFAVYTRDVNTGKMWPQMTNAERIASAINTNRVIWTGVNANAAAPDVLSPGTPSLKVLSPGTLGSFRIGAAVFGAPLASPGITGDLVVALDPADAAGPTTFDACSPLTNAAAVAGKIALADRGTCGFIVKVKNAQDAGAIAVVVVDNVVDAPPPGLGGVDPTITITSARVSLPDGNRIKTALASGSVQATLGIDAAVLLGTEASTGKLLLNAPNPVQSGSSISHWDPIASRNLLMEPAISDDLPGDVDLTLEQFVDIGWFSDFDGVPDGEDACIGSDQSATVVIGGCDSGVDNTVFADGCRISDLVADCAEGAGNHGGFVSCVAHLTNDLKKGGVITGEQKGAVQSCAGQAAIP